MFIAMANALNPKIMDRTRLDICLSIEMTHAASCLVDDILDGDDVRHGYQSAQAILGTPVSVLQAHFLCAQALKLVSRWPDVSKLLVTTYQKLTVGEMYDIFLPEPTTEWIYEGYTEQIYQKTSAMFEFSLETAALVTKRNDLQKGLKSLGHALGKMYQLSNDYFDMRPENIRKRHSTDHTWRITFSLPLACYLKLHGSIDIQKELNKCMLTYSEWLSFIKKLWTNDVKKLAKKMMRDTEKEVRKLIMATEIPKGVQIQFSSLLELILQEDFWYHSYAE